MRNLFARKYPVTDGEYEALIDPSNKLAFIQQACNFKWQYPELRDFPCSAFHELELGMGWNFNFMLLHTETCESEPRLHIIEISLSHAKSLLQKYWFQHNADAFSFGNKVSGGAL